MKAATYVRESTRAQEEGFSPDAQRQALAQYAAQQGIEIVAAFDDFESGAAFSVVRLGSRALCPLPCDADKLLTTPRRPRCSGSEIDS